MRIGGHTKYRSAFDPSVRRSERLLVWRLGAESTSETRALVMCTDRRLNLKTYFFVRHHPGETHAM